jgi:hypothetical protein
VGVPVGVMVGSGVKVGVMVGVSSIRKVGSGTRPVARPNRPSPAKARAASSARAYGFG